MLQRKVRKFKREFLKSTFKRRLECWREVLSFKNEMKILNLKVICKFETVCKSVQYLERKTKKKKKKTG